MTDNFDRSRRELAESGKKTSQLNENSPPGNGAAPEDPLAELIRLVKQEDPFAGKRQEVNAEPTPVPDHSQGPKSQDPVAETAQAPAPKPPSIAPAPSVAPAPALAADSPAAKFIIEEPVANAPSRDAVSEPIPAPGDHPVPSRETAPQENFVPPILEVRPPGPVATRQQGQQQDLDARPGEAIVRDPVIPESVVEEAGDLPPIDLDAALKAVRESDLVTERDFHETAVEAQGPAEIQPFEPIPANTSGGEFAAMEDRGPYFDSEIGNPYEDPAFASEAAASDQIAASTDWGDNLGFEPAGSEHGEISQPGALSAEEAGFGGAQYRDDRDGVGEPARRRGVVFAVGLLLGLAVLAGSLAFAFLGSDEGTSSSPPPVLRANSDPAKVAPDNPGGQAIDYQNSLVYEGNGANNPASNEQLVPREEAIVGVPKVNPKDSARPGAAPSGLPAPLQPGAPATTRLASVPPASGANNGAAGASSLVAPSTNVAPTARRVRTVIVRPDGTIVANEASAPAASSSPANESARSVPVPSTRPAPPGDSRAAQQTAAVAPAQPRPASAANTNGPISLTPPPHSAQPQSAPAPQAAANPAPAPFSAPAAGSAQFAVQVAARRSEEQANAAFTALRSQYRSQVGNYRPLVQRADLGDRGVYYRLRIGPMTSYEEATQVCNNLKAAGLSDCLVRPQ